MRPLVQKGRIAGIRPIFPFYGPFHVLSPKLRAHPRSFDLPRKAEAAFKQTSPQKLIPRKSGPVALGTAAEVCWLLLRARLALEGL